MGDRKIVALWDKSRGGGAEIGTYHRIWNRALGETGRIRRNLILLINKAHAVGVESRVCGRQGHIVARKNQVSLHGVDIRLMEILVGEIGGHKLAQTVKTLGREHSFGRKRNALGVKSILQDRKSVV